MPGPIVPGNIDIAHRPIVLNPDGSISTVYSRSDSDAQGREVLIPSVIPSPQGGYMVDKSRDGKASWDYYRKSGQHLGMFANPDDATAYAVNLHNDYADGKLNFNGKPNLSVNGSPIEMSPSHPQDKGVAIRAELMRLMGRR